MLAEKRWHIAFENIRVTRAKLLAVVDGYGCNPRKAAGGRGALVSPVTWVTLNFVLAERYGYVFFVSKIS